MTDDKKLLSDMVGFHYMIFCSTLRGFVRCWLDGDDNYTYYTVSNILDFCNQNGKDFDVSNALANALSESSMFLWAVNERVVKRISSQHQGSNIGEMIQQMKEKQNDRHADGQEPLGWRNELSQDSSGNVTLKF